MSLTLVPTLTVGYRASNEFVTWKKRSSRNLMVSSAATTNGRATKRQKIS